MTNGQELSCVQIEGPIRTEKTIFEHTVSQRIDSLPRVSLIRNAARPSDQLASRAGRGCGTRAERQRPEAARQRQTRSEEHTSELQSRLHLVCRLLLEQKKHTRHP